METFSLYLFNYPEKVMCITKDLNIGYHALYATSTSILMFKNGFVEEVLKDRYGYFKKHERLIDVFESLEKDYSCGFFQGTSIISTGKYKDSFTVMKSLKPFYDEIHFYSKFRDNK